MPKKSENLVVPTKHSKPFGGKRLLATILSMGLLGGMWSTGTLHDTQKAYAAKETAFSISAEGKLQGSTIRYDIKVTNLSDTALQRRYKTQIKGTPCEPILTDGWHAIKDQQYIPVGGTAHAYCEYQVTGKELPTGKFSISEFAIYSQDGGEPDYTGTVTATAKVTEVLEQPDTDEQAKKDQVEIDDPVREDPTKPKGEISSPTPGGITSTDGQEGKPGESNNPSETPSSEVTEATPGSETTGASTPGAQTSDSPAPSESTPEVTPTNGAGSPSISTSVTPSASVSPTSSGSTSTAPSQQPSTTQAPKKDPSKDETVTPTSEPSQPSSIQLEMKSVGKTATLKIVDEDGENKGKNKLTAKYQLTVTNKSTNSQTYSAITVRPSVLKGFELLPMEVTDPEGKKIQLTEERDQLAGATLKAGESRVFNMTVSYLANSDIVATQWEEVASCGLDDGIRNKAWLVPANSSQTKHTSEACVSFAAERNIELFITADYGNAKVSTGSDIVELWYYVTVKNTGNITTSTGYITDTLPTPKGVKVLEVHPYPADASHGYTVKLNEGTITIPTQEMAPEEEIKYQFHVLYQLDFTKVDESALETCADGKGLINTISSLGSKSASTCTAIDMESRYEYVSAYASDSQTTTIKNGELSVVQHYFVELSNTNAGQITTPPIVIKAQAPGMKVQSITGSDDGHPVDLAKGVTLAHGETKTIDIAVTFSAKIANLTDANFVALSHCDGNNFNKGFWADITVDKTTLPACMHLDGETSISFDTQFGMPNDLVDTTPGKQSEVVFDITSSNRMLLKEQFESTNFLYSRNSVLSDISCSDDDIRSYVEKMWDNSVECTANLTPIATQA